jgi:hypothetical protein
LATANGADEAVAAARPDRDFDGHPYVRLVREFLLRRRGWHRSGAAPDNYRRLNYRKYTNMKTIRKQNLLAAALVGVLVFAATFIRLWILPVAPWR